MAKNLTDWFMAHLVGSPSEPPRLGTGLFTSPPLVHFTTADWNDLADGKRNLDAVVGRLQRLEAGVLVTPEHLIEWIPVTVETRHRRFLLADRLPRVIWADWGSRTIWDLESRQLQTLTVRSPELKSFFYDIDGNLQEWLRQRRRLELGQGAAEFFGRNARMPGRDRAKSFDPILLKKYHKLNLKHGSDLTRQWRLGNWGAGVAEAVASILGPLVPDTLKDGLKGRGSRWLKALTSVEPAMHASFHGVPRTNVGFALWWETRRKLWAKPDEVGGLSEMVDLQELRLWPLCAMITVDKRIHAAVCEALRTLGWPFAGTIAERFVRAGDHGGMLARLDQLLNSPKAEPGFAPSGDDHSLLM